MIRLATYFSFALFLAVVPALDADAEIVNASLDCSAKATFLSADTPPISASCCPCDYSSSYQSCVAGCSGNSACEQDCFDDWMAAENWCIQNCPYGQIC